MLKNLIEYMGIEPDRLHFSWISSAEAGKFVESVKEITEAVRRLGPTSKLVKQLPILEEVSAGSDCLAADRR